MKDSERFLVALVQHNSIRRALASVQWSWPMVAQQAATDEKFARGYAAWEEGRKTRRRRVENYRRQRSQVRLLPVPPTVREAPTAREDCEHGPRPCPWVGCRYHLMLHLRMGVGSSDPHGDVGPSLHYVDPEEWGDKETCALDVAARGAQSLEDVGVHLDLTRERVRQLEVMALDRMKELGAPD